jgi:hypothetical protein
VSSYWQYHTKRETPTGREAAGVHPPVTERPLSHGASCRERDASYASLYAALKAKGHGYGPGLAEPGGLAPAEADGHAVRPDPL